MSVCPKHDPRPYNVTAIERALGLVSTVICSHCGRIGMKSNGRQMIGRPRRIRWLRKWDLGSIACDSNGNDWDGLPLPETGKPSPASPISRSKELRR